MMLCGRIAYAGCTGNIDIVDTWIEEGAVYADVQYSAKFTGGSALAQVEGQMVVTYKKEGMDRQYRAPIKLIYRLIKKGAGTLTNVVSFEQERCKNAKCTVTGAEIKYIKVSSGYGGEC